VRAFLVLLFILQFSAPLGHADGLCGTQFQTFLESLTFTPGPEANFAHHESIFSEQLTHLSDAELYEKIQFYMDRDLKEKWILPGLKPKYYARKTSGLIRDYQINHLNADGSKLTNFLGNVDASAKMQKQLMQMSKTPVPNPRLVETYSRRMPEALALKELKRRLDLEKFR
jgi:hypothetical protein